MSADTTDTDSHDDDRADAEERLRILGDLLARGWQTQRDLDEVRALPGPYLRGHASIKHYALFVECRRLV